MFRSFRFLTVNAFLSSAGVLLAGLAFPAIVFAQPPAKSESAELVADLETKAIDYRNGITPVGLSHGEFFYMQVRTSGAYAQELWASDGTPEGTRSLVEGCIYCRYGHTEILASTPDGTFLAMGGSEMEQRRLWFTGGTPDTTRALTEPLRWQEHPYHPVSFSAWEPSSGRLFFRGYTLDQGPEPWVSDGTLAGTRRIAELYPGFPGSDPAGFVAWNGRVFFAARVAEEEWYLWVSDGTAAGTRQILRLDEEHLGGKDWPPTFVLKSTPHGVVFYRWLEGSGYEIWVTDGTTTGSRRLASLDGSTGPGYNSELEPFLDGYMLRTANEEGGSTTWYTDGTPQGTGPFFDGYISVRPVRVGDRAFFASGPGLWISDGTRAGTRLVLETCDDGCSGPQVIHNLTAVGDDRVVFWSPAPGGRIRYWSTDGTPGDLVSPVSGDRSRPATPLDFSTFALPSGEVLLHVPLGAKGKIEQSLIYLSDGTRMGTSLLLELPEGETAGQPSALGDDEVLIPVGTPYAFGAGFSHFLKVAGTQTERLDPQPDDRNFGSYPHHLSVLGDHLVFVLGEVEGRGDLYALSQSDGVPRRIFDANPTLSSSLRFWPGPAVELGEHLFYVAPPEGSTLHHLWRFDKSLPTAAAPVDLGELPRGRLEHGPYVALGKIFWWLKTDSSAPSELWVSDGTAAGTRLLSAEAGPMDDLYDFVPAEHRGRLYFVGNRGNLWWTDGETVAEIHRGSESGVDFSAGRVLSMGDRVLFFTAYTELWASGGDEASTVLLSRVGYGNLGFTYAAVLDGVAYFSGYAEGLGRELWRSDGTPEGTYLLADLFPGRGESLPWQFTPFDGRMYFAAETEETGDELWVTDGTAAGTRPVVDLLPGPLDSLSLFLSVVGNRLLWSASDGTHGEELWSLSAGSDRPQRLTDVADGPLSATPAGMTLFGGRLFFSALHEKYGRELWSLPADAGPPPPCGTDPLDLCLLGDRVRVRVSWTDQRSGKSGVGTPVPFSDKTGLFWFFDDANIELVVKALDGTGTNGHLWGFYGALSDVIYTVELTDTVTGRVRTFENPAGEICGGADTRALTVGDSAVGDFARTKGLSEGVPGRWLPLPTVSNLATRTTGTCQPGAETLCLLGGRFAVTVEWDNQRADPGEPNDAGTGKVIPSLGDGDKSGYFWFFDSANIELVVKALDGTGINGNYWFFYGALSDVEYTITVRDTTTGAEKTYRNEPGNICGGADNRAFPE